MSKFKVGDRVIVLPTDRFHKKEYVSKAYTIRGLGSRSTSEFLKWVFEHTDDGASTYWYREEELELESVINSPLYKALE